MLVKSKLDSIEILIFQALSDMGKSHKELKAIIILRRKKCIREWKRMWGMPVKNKRIWD